jgi:NADPH2:quinone reductase
MRVVEIAGPGGPDVLRVVERPAPEPGAGEVLIRVAAAGVNRPDIIQRLGKYPPPPGASDIPGLEVAGTVVAVGRPIDAPLRWKPGDRVMALLAGGGYAELAVAPAAQCLPVPDGLSFVEAAAIPETYFTVWSNLFDRARLEPGESLLVHGGASGIGTTAIQMAHAFGARVFTTARTPERCAMCERLGAGKAIDYEKEDFVEVVRALTGGRGVDVVLDMVGGDYVPRNLELLAEDGRLVLIALLRGSRAEIDLGRVMRRRLTITGSTLRPRPVEVKGRIAEALERHVLPLVATRRIGPIIHATFPLDRAVDAHRALEAGGHFGKIVLIVDEELARRAD